MSTRELPQTVDWKEILGWELEGPEYFYTLKADPQIIQKYVYAATLSTLVGEEVQGFQVRRAIDGDDLIDDDEIEAMAINHFTPPNKTEYQRKAIEEASQQAQRAVQEFETENDDYSFSASWDYFDYNVPIKTGIDLDPIKGHKGWLRMTAPVGKILETHGFPYTILTRNFSKEDLDRAMHPPSIDWLKELALELHIEPDTIFDHFANDYIWHSYSGVYLSELDLQQWYDQDQALRALERGETFGEIFKKFPPIAQQRAIGVRFGLGAEVNYPMTFGNSLATLSISAYGDGYCRFDPNIGHVVGDIDSNNYDSLYVRLQPVVTPETSHSELLKLRDLGLKLINDLGIPGQFRFF